MAFPGKSDWNIPHNFAPWVWSEGGSFLIKDSSHWRSNILAPQSIRGIRRYIGLVLDSLASSATLGLNTASVSQRFNNGEQVFIIGTTEVLAQSRIPVSEGGLKSSAIGKMGISGFSIPSGSHGSLVFLGGSHLAIPIKHQKDKRAKQLLEFLTRSENLLYYSKKIGFLPSDQKSLKTLKQDSLYRSLIETLPYSKSYPNHPEWGSIGALLIEMFTAIWSLVDVEGFYSDAELYEIMIQYNRMLNHQMGYEKQETIPTIEEFKSYLDAPDEFKLSKKENKPKNTLILWVGGIFFILLVIWALFRSKNSMG